MGYMKISNMVMRHLGKKPATLMYPVIPREWYENTRGRIEIEIDACIFCGICSKKCPTGAIAVNRDEKSWAIERMNCIQCSCCVDYCPKKCLINEAGYTTPDSVKAVDSFVKQEEPAEEAEAPAEDATVATAETTESAEEEKDA
jgi:Formate hydrogenlyase subunit 6/NADH:ubiquinone oxidoreductase 23 kD subunit (chain I)